MTLDIVGVLQRGIERTIARNGLLFIGLFFALGAVSTLVSVPFAGAPGARPAVDGAPIVAALIGLFVSLVSALLFVVALRTFVSGETERIPREHASRNVLWALLNLVVGGVVFAIVVAFGFVALVIPGLFLLVSLFFWNVYVVVEDQSFVEGFRSSWELTKGHRLRLFGLGVLVVIVTSVVNLLFGIPAVVDPLFGAIVGQAGSAVTTVFTIATIARAYEELAGLDTPEDVMTAESDTRL